MSEIKNSKNSDIATLVSMKNGENSRIVKIDTEDVLKLRKMAAFGIMPGVQISMIQRYPAYVIQVGFTQVALDKEIASKILVSKS
jgi:ferrous iron transport protein A